MTLFLSLITALIPLIGIILKREFDPETKRRREQKKIDDAIGRGARGVDDLNRIVDRL